MKRIILLSKEINKVQEGFLKDILGNYGYIITKLDKTDELSTFIKHEDVDTIFVDLKLFSEVKNLLNKNKFPFIFLLLKRNTPLMESIKEIEGVVFLDTNKVSFEKQIIFVIKHILLESSLKNFSRVIDPEFLRKLLGDTAHAINNILTGMQGYAELALLNPDDKKLIEDSFKVVMDSSYRVRSEIKNLRAFVRIENPKIENVTISNVVKQAIDLVKPQCRSKNCTINYEMEKNYLVEGDEDQLVQVFFNILRDLIEDANENTKIGIISNSDDESVIINLSCEKCRVSEEEYKTIKRILAINEPILKMDSKEGEIENKNVLSMCNRIIFNHKGNISIEKKGRSIVYSVALPYIEQPSVEIKEGVLAPSSYADSFENLDMDVLVVDDEEFVRNTLYYFFQQKGCRVTLAEDGKYGLEIAKKKPFDIVFMDYLMPKMGGIKSAKEILKYNSDVRIVFITGKEVTDENEIIKSGVYSIIKKPFEIEDIYSVAKKVAMEKGLGG